MFFLFSFSLYIEEIENAAYINRKNDSLSHEFHDDDNSPITQTATPFDIHVFGDLQL